MKKNILLILSVLLVSYGYSQSQRLVLVEEFTQASCGPCGAQNPAFNTMLNSKQGKIVPIKYQVSWPGTDPMNAQNPSQVQTRVTYYTVGGVPAAWMDGVQVTNDCGYYAGAPACLTGAEVEAEYLVPSTMTVGTYFTLSAEEDSIFITANFAADSLTAGFLRAYVVLVEKNIYFATAPGTNGETHFEYVMKQMFPSASGAILAYNDYPAGTDSTFNFKWKLTNIYNKDELAVVAFVQNSLNKKIVQAGFSGTKSATGNKELAVKTELSIYPNPSLDGIFTLKGMENLKGNGSVKVTNLLGSSMFDQKLSFLRENSGRLDLSNLSRGVYLVSIVTDGKSIVKKITITK